MRLTRGNRNVLRRTPAALLEALEGRQMLAVNTVFQDGDGDFWSVQVTGANAQAVIVAGSEGLRSLVITGTTATSDVTISEAFPPRGAPARLGDDGELFINFLNIQGDVDEVRLLDNVNLRRENAQVGFAGLDIDGRARVIEIRGDVIASDINIDSTAANNRTTINLNVAGGFFNNNRGGFADPVAVTSGGYVETFTCEAFDAATLQAKRFGLIDVAAGGIFRGNGFPLAFDITTTDGTAQYGVKTILVDGSLVGGTWDIAAPVQKVLINEVPNDPFDLARGFGPISTFEMTVNGRVDELRSTLGDLSGHYRASSFGIVRAAQDLRGIVFGNDVARGTFELASIDTLRAGDDFGNVNVFATGKVKQIVSSDSVFDSTFRVGSVDSLEVGGFFSNSRLALTQSGGTGLKQASFRNGMFASSSIDALDSNIGTITTPAILGSRITAGIIAPANALVANSAGFNSNRTIASIVIKKNGTGGAFIDSYINAHTISNLFSNADVTTNNGSVPFGAAAVTFGTVSFRVNAGTTLGAGQSSGDLIMADL